MNNINAIIIDDELPFQASLEIILKKNYPHIKINAKAENVEEGIKAIDKHKPNLVFLDINLPDGLGFDILDKCSFKDFEVIFTTSFNEYAVRAFEVSALHYLLKPIDEIQLKNAINRFDEKNLKDLFDEKLTILKASMHENPQKIVLHEKGEYKIFNIADIVRCEADKEYVNVYFNDGKSILLSKTLKSLQNILTEQSFVRVHNKHLINLRYVKSYILGKNAVLYINEKDYPISQNQVAEFKEKMKQYVKTM